MITWSTRPDDLVPTRWARKPRCGSFTASIDNIAGTIALGIENCGYAQVHVMSLSVLLGSKSWRGTVARELRTMRRLNTMALKEHHATRN